jgi:hypothetical protein
MTKFPFVTKRRAILVACLLALGLLAVSRRPGTTHAQSSGPWNITPMSNGVLMIGSLGSVSFCPAYSLVSGTGSGVTITQTGECTLLGSKVAVPTSDKWTMTAVNGSSINGDNAAVAFLLDNADGRIVECSVVTSYAGVGQTTYVNGACVNMGVLPR